MHSRHCEIHTDDTNSPTKHTAVEELVIWTRLYANIPVMEKHVGREVTKRVWTMRLIWATMLKSTLIIEGRVADLVFQQPYKQLNLDDETTLWR